MTTSNQQTIGNLRILGGQLIQKKAREIDSIADAISEVDSAWMASAERDRDEAAQLQQAVQRLAGLIEGGVNQ